MDAPPAILVIVLAHNEERRIGRCLESLPLGKEGIAVTVVVNGSSDSTAAIVGSFAGRGVRLVDYPEGGKSRSWNRFVLDEAPEAETFVFVDGDAEVQPGSVAALARCLALEPRANAASGMPRNGRRAAAYRRSLARDRGLFGDLYALSGDFVNRMRSSGIRLPKDLVGDDSLIGALAHTDLGGDEDWRDERIIPCFDAGFLCEPHTRSPAGLRLQARRMVSYSVRHFQNRIISAIMRSEGPRALPPRMVDIYPDWLDRLRPRAHPMWFWFDRAALRRMRAELKRAA